MDRKHAVVGGVRQIERAGAGVGLDDVVEAAGHPLHLRKRDQLMRGAGIAYVDDDVIGAAGEQEIAVRRHLPRVRVVLRNHLGLAALEIDAGRSERKNGLGVERGAIRIVAGGHLHQSRIAVTHRVGVALEHLAVREHDVVITARRGGGRVGRRQGDAVLLGIDHRQRRVAILVLQRPDFMRDRIEFQPVNVTGDLISLLDMAGPIIFDDGARTG
jgi:hypothetical protein